MLNIMLLADAKQKELKAEIRKARKADWYRSLLIKEEKVRVHQTNNGMKKDMICCSA